MVTTYFEHPTEDELERFLLSQSSEEESELVESHFLGCPSCVTRLESLEQELVVLKSALTAFELERREKQAARAARFERWRQWFTLPKLSLAGAGAIAALAVGTFVIPQESVNIALSPDRGTDVQVVPEHRSVRLHLNAPNVTDGPVSVELLQVDGQQIWSTTAIANNHQVEVRIPKINEPGSHFVRLSKPGGSDEADLLQEYSVQVK